MSDVVVQACPVVDELVTDEGAVVLIREPGGDHRVLRLSLLGQLIRELAADAITIDQLVMALESEVGSAPQGDAPELVRHAVAELEKDGLVALGSRDPGESPEDGTKRD